MSTGPVAASDPPSSDERPPPAVPMSGRGRTVRWIVTAVILALTLTGTVWGQDGAFPFGPFRMYAARNDPNGVVNSTRLEAVNVDGERIRLSQVSLGVRRAEFEGQLPRLREDPGLLHLVAEAYENRNPDRPALVTIEVIVRKHELKDGLETGSYVDEVVATWTSS